MLLRRLLTLCTLLCLATFVAAQPAVPLPSGVTISARVEPATIFLRDQFEYTVEIIGNATVEQWEYPAFSKTNGLALVGGPLSQTNLRYENGVSSTQQANTFTLMATAVGTFTIPETTVRIRGTAYKTNAVEIIIKDIPTGSGDIAGIISGRSPDTPSLNPQLENRYFAMMEVPDSGYRGQAIPLRIYVYRQDLQEFVQWELPKTSGGADFLTPAFDQRSVVQPIKWEEVTMADRRFQRGLLFTNYVIPTRAGKLTLDAPIINIALSVRSRQSDPFNSMQFGRNMIATVQLAMRSRELVIEEPPEKPADAILQVIGRVTPEVIVDRTSVPHREILTVSMKLGGATYLDLVSAPAAPVLSGFTLLDTKTESNSANIRGDLKSVKKFDFIYQAMQPGKSKLPALKFSVFDPDTKTATMIETPGVELEVLGSVGSAVQIGGSTAPTAAAPSTAAKMLGRDVAYISTEPLSAAAIGVQTPFFARPLFWWLQLVPLALAVIYGVAIQRARRTVSLTPEEQAARARAAAHAALKSAREQVAGAKRDVFYATLADGMLEFIAARVGASARGLTTEAAVAALIEQGVKQDVSTALGRMLEGCNAMRYSPASDTAEDRARILLDAEALLASLTSGGRA